MQRQTTDFSKQPLILDSILKELEQLKTKGRRGSVVHQCEHSVDKLETDHGIKIGRSRPARRCLGDESAESLVDFRAKAALPYIDCLVHNIHNQFSGEAVSLLVSSSVFNPAYLPDKLWDKVNQGSC